jgi:hypothetical protein
MFPEFQVLLIQDSTAQEVSITVRNKVGLDITEDQYWQKIDQSWQFLLSNLTSINLTETVELCLKNNSNHAYERRYACIY